VRIEALPRVADGGEGAAWAALREEAGEGMAGATAAKPCNGVEAAAV
jgi:hypothetical protein